MRFYKFPESVPNPGGDITYVAQTAPGVVMNTAAGLGNFSVFGLPGTSNNFTMNGMEVNDPFLNRNNSGPSQDRRRELGSRPGRLTDVVQQPISRRSGIGNIFMVPVFHWSDGTAAPHQALD
jgi:hypothetical protein